MHSLEFLIVDALAGVLDNTVGFFGGFNTGILDNLIAGEAGVAKELVALDFGFAKEVFDGEEGNLDMNEIKMLLPVNDRMFENWKGFCRAFLGHLNPYTGLTYAQDPAVAWISLINEGNYGNYFGGLRDRTRNGFAHGTTGRRRNTAPPKSATPPGEPRKTMRSRSFRTEKAPSPNAAISNASSMTSKQTCSAACATSSTRSSAARRC